ncbi:TWiK family of potassium channels protein 7-like [Aricia agestis]|uniref:TWiK family of potassium channels protein 7-like n=1 Tax=Aricia agestis TaxID=91739 RepID=UPI001C20899D|nr:TWiK family of potassium channels protein 7-like [Aricia agestis]
MNKRAVRDVSRHLHKNGSTIISRPALSLRTKNLKMYCCRCFHKRRTSLLTCIAICFLVLTYNILGGFIFLAIESPKSYVYITPSKSSAESQSEAVRLKTVERLWTITEDLNILYKQNWTKLADKELVDFHKIVLETLQHESVEQHRENRWTYAESFLYALTLITTIGNGNIRPTSLTGKTVAIGYAGLGIPIVILYLSTVGEIFARKIRSLYYKLSPESIRSKNFHSKADCLSHCRCHIIQDPKGVIEADEMSEQQMSTPFHAALNMNGLNGEFHWMCRDHTRVPIIFSILIIVFYVVIGAFIFHVTEDWTFVDALYFSFSVLATIGFGYLKPGSYASSISTKAEDLAIGVCCVYILFGVVVIAMCFNLIQDDVGLSLRGFTSFCMGSPKSRVVYNVQAAGETTLVPVI